MPEGDPLWYKDAVIYQLHVRSFFDSVDDGIGDFAGLTQKLDYVQELGVTALWLLPFYPSPLKDDGYDTANYVDVHPSYGTLRDFKRFLHAAHERGMRVITELVLNHTSDQHPWFQRARRAPPGSPARDFYVWSDDPHKYAAARIIFKDFEASNWSWDPIAKSYFWHRFYSHQPDLNFENPAVRQALFQVVDYWMKMGVDGLRLDAVPYLYEREGTNCENLPETHAFLRELRTRVDKHSPQRMLLAEANQWPEDAIAYFGDGDECHAAFHFPIMPRLFMATHMEDRFPVVDILEQTPTIPNNCQWFIFLRNHDELTLEMVTDEERDYMYRVYAHDPQARINLGIRRRLAPLLGNNRRKIELMNGLLFSLPGTPIVYYGDEIGMGDNIYLGDRNGVRTPMQWSSDRNAGFSRARPQQLFLPVSIEQEYHFESVYVETQRRNPQSLWWWMKRLIALRQSQVAFSRGSLDMLAPENQKIVAFIRRHEEDCVLVVANLSRFVQYVELDLSAYEGRRPRELFGQTKFPAIGKLPYLLTMGPHAFYWFSLERKTESPAAAQEDNGLPTLRVAEGIEELFYGSGRISLERAFMAWLPSRPWLVGTPRPIQSVKIHDVIDMHLAGDRGDVYWALLHVEHTEGDAEDYVVPLAIATGAEGERVAHELGPGPLARVRTRQSGEIGVIYEAMRDATFGERLFRDVLKRRRWPGAVGELISTAGAELAEVAKSREGTPSIVAGKRSYDRSFIWGDKVIFKLYRRIGAGVHPDLELCRFLTEETNFQHAPEVLGVIEYRPEVGLSSTLGVLQAFVAGSTNGWQFTLDSLSRYFELVLAQPPEARPGLAALPSESLWDLAAGAAPAAAGESMSGYLDAANLLGKCTGQMHAALGSRPEIPEFAPEPVTQFDGRSLYQSMRKLMSRTRQALKATWRDLPEGAQTAAQGFLKIDKELLERVHGLATRKTSAVRIRCHGRYRLGEVLFTGKEFTVFDFGDASEKAFTEQRLKRVPLCDVASMLRSMHYATAHAVHRIVASGLAQADSLQSLHDAARFWYVWASSSFLRGYSAAVAGAGVLPTNKEELESLFQFYQLEKGIGEVEHTIRRRPELAEYVLNGVLDLTRR